MSARMSRADALVKTALASLARKEADARLVQCSRADYEDIGGYLQRIGVDTSGEIGVMTPKGRVPLRCDPELSSGEFTFTVRFPGAYLADFAQEVSE